MSEEIFSVYRILKEQGIPNAEELANSLQEVFTKYPYWHMSEDHGIKVRRSLHKILTKTDIKDDERISEIVQNIIDILKQGRENDDPGNI